jgi:hypothetical protein
VALSLWLPNQDNGLFGKDDSNKYQGYKLIFGLKGNPVEAMDAYWQQWLCLWYGSYLKHQVFASLYISFTQ